MSRRKLQKFRDNQSRNNVIQEGKPLFDKIKGNWRSTYFENDHPIVLELGCGRGEYTIGMARLNPENNYIGVDIKGDRIWKGSKIAHQDNLLHVGFLRTQVQSLETFFEDGEVDEIWLTFPDPRPKKSDIKRRMTHPRFMEIYRKVLKPGGRLHLKTDNDTLYQYTMEVVEQLAVEQLVYTDNLYQSDLLTPRLTIRTHYEELFSQQGFTIKYLSFIFATA